MKFGENLKRLRKLNKLSQEKLAELVEVSRQSVSKWECGESYPTMTNIFSLCTIFKCKISDLVNENIIDINSLDDEIKMSVVKFKKEKQKQKQMRGLSKAIYIIARIISIISIIGIISVAIAMIAIPFISKNVSVNDNTINFYGEKIKYQKEENGYIVKYKNKTMKVSEKESINRLDIIKNHKDDSIYLLVGFVEVAFVFLIIFLALTNLVAKTLEKLFVNIYNGDTPFTLENIAYIKKMSYMLIFMIIVPNIGGTITQMIIKQDLNIGFELVDCVSVLVLFSMSYIFEYGYEIQKDSKGKLYGDDDES